MYIKNDTIGVIFRVLFLIVCGAGLVMKLFASGFSLAVVLGDFALLANALALVYFAYLIIARPSWERGFLRGAVTVYMIVTFLVYYYLNFGTGSGLREGLSLASVLQKRRIFGLQPGPVGDPADFVQSCRIPRQPVRTVAGADPVL